VVCRAIDWHKVDQRRLDRVVSVSGAHGLVHTPTLVATEGLLAYRDYRRAVSRADVRLLPPLYPRLLWHPDKGLPVYRNLHAARLDRAAQALQKKLRLVHDLHGAGVPLLLGTDTQQPFVVPGAALHREMHLFGTAGLPPAEVWRLATIQAARALAPHVDEPLLGQLRASAPADLLVYDADPTGAVEPGRGLRAVISRGILYRHSDLRAAVDRYARRYRSLDLLVLGHLGAKRAIRATRFAR
jgi:imidazolonepropionase-like amidohydrolase